MGFISAPAGTLPDFSKAVISLWFRIPQATYTAAVVEANAFLDGDSSKGVWTGLIPLLTWGSKSTAVGASGEVPIGMSCIGVIAGVRGPDQYGNPGAGPVTGCCIYARMQYLDGGGSSFSGGDLGDAPDFFEVGAVSFLGNTFTESPPWHEQPIKQIPITPDVWHHVLISFDLSNGATGTYNSTKGITVYSVMSQFYWAVDDVNYNGHYLGPNTAWPGDDGHGSNDISSTWAGEVVGDNSGHTIGTAQCIGRPLPAAGYPVSLPAGSADVAAIKAVDMAEFQMFTGVTLDTSNVDNRRAFIDKDGKPVSPRYLRDANTGEITADPAKSPPFALLGKLPNIALCQSSGNWTGGIDLGSATTDFTPTGKIKPVNPNPKLGT